MTARLDRARNYRPILYICNMDSHSDLTYVHDFAGLNRHVDKIRPISRINLFEAAEFRVPPRRDVRIVARLFYAVP